MKFSLLLFFVLLFCSCSNDKIINKEFDLVLNQKIALGVYECASIETFTICVDSISSDSRCPSDLVCIWAGNAQVDFSILNKNKEHQFSLNTNSGKQFISDTIIGDYHIFLLDLTPYPVSTTSINQSDYSASLKIELIEKYY